ncbi:MAG: PTS system mannose/fructose/sorbose family transporter subunit IID [Oscillospiraceae bacterium]|nr:PTS system mannose/fructose/sorbose family transporter subunit IID [Oscillospiraceae bacterium]
MSEETTAVATTDRIDKKDLRRLFFRSNAIQSAFNFERMQGLGFVWGMLPLINKLYKNKEDRIEAYKRHSGYFNTHPWLGGIIFGIVASMEERKAHGEEMDEENIQAVKGALMGPLAGLGDSMFFSTFRPIVAGICASLALSGSVIAPIIFVLLINIVHFGVQWWGVHSGYELADKFLEKLEGMQIQRWMEAATILGLMVVGALVASALNISTPLTYTVGDASVALQDMFDKILPKLLPLGATLAVYAFVRKGKNAMIVMLGIIVVGFVLGLLGVL